MEKTFDPHAIEEHWYRVWEERGCFAPSGDGAPYCIMIPPPNVTGTLHMGHAFQDTIMDALTRFYRMRGRNTLWQPGTDHAGIATQMVVERQLNAEGKTRRDVGRDAFVERVWEWKAVSGGTITRQLRRMGASVDWVHERFTMDEGLSHAVRETFVRLYEEGLIYRGKRLVNWDPVLRTAVSDLEVVAEEEDGHLWHMRYPLADGPGHLVVATTRPETMLGDTAVAVHPDDERYRHLVGRDVVLPLAERRIPVIADAYVDPAFGSGCVKITPAHDFNDYEVGRRHTLEQINVLTADARINDSAPSRYRGLDRFEARKLVVADLQEQGLLEKTEPHRLKVPRGDRSHSVIEPFLTDQWFVRTAPLAQPAIAAVEEGRIRFVPENWAKTYFEWMRNIEDWCISRQIWWGHRIPAWYDPDGNVYVGRSEDEVRERHGLGATLALEQDPDVLDTWYSSALWPFSTLGWPDSGERLATWYPTSVLVTGFDIIFFWVARMIMMGLRFMGDVPFHEVYIHGLVRDADGNKMSKSKGNILDPLDLIDGIELDALVAKRTTGLMQPELAPRIEADTRRQFPEGIPSYGTDALRFTFCSLATQGRDVRFDLGRIEGYRNFCNKLWNASRFVMQNTQGADCGTDAATPVSLGTAERWIVSRLQETERAVVDAVEHYRFDLAAQAIYEFTWNEYCDWYVELAKTVLYDEGADEAARIGTRRTLVRVLEALLRLAHPIIPFITESIWQRVRERAGKSGDTIMRQSYPEPDPRRIDPASMEEMTWVREFVLGVRRIRSEMNVPPSRRIPVLLAGGDATDDRRAQEHFAYLARLASLERIERLRGDPPRSAKALLGRLEILVPLEGVVDLGAERARIDKELARLSRELERSEKKLANERFRERAPAEVVAKEQERVADFRDAIARLEAQRTSLAD
jgi:valyl-tRNA synthetase